MTACLRSGCGGTVGVFGDFATCSLCARPLVGGPRPPTAEEAGDKRLIKPNVTDYFIGVYAVDYPGP